MRAEAETFHLGTATVTRFVYISIKRAAAVTARWILTWLHLGFIFWERRAQRGKELWCGEWIFAAGSLECWVLIDWIVPPLNHSRSSFCIQPFRNINTIMVVHHHRCVCLSLNIYLRLRGKSRFEINTHTQHDLLMALAWVAPKVVGENRSELSGWQIYLWFTLSGGFSDRSIIFKSLLVWLMRNILCLKGLRLIMTPTSMKKYIIVIDSN